METTEQPSISAEAEQYRQYRTLSFAAIVALVFGLVSTPIAIAASLNPFLLIFPFVGVLVGIGAVLRLRNRTDEFTGFGAAKLGLALSGIVLCIGSVYAAYVYATEVPKGYERVSFTDLQPDPRNPAQQVPPDVGQLDHKKIFLKGYVYPDDQLGAIKRFILVPDMGTCCFGGQPKLTDMVQVTLKDPLRVKYSYFRRSLGGEFFLAQRTADKVGNVIYHLDADYVK